MTFSFELPATRRADEASGAAYITQVKVPVEFERLWERYRVLADENARLRAELERLRAELDLNKLNTLIQDNS